MTTFLDLVRKAAQEKKELIQKGGEGSGWYAPPKGTHVEGAEAGNIIPETYKQNKRTVGILDVKDRVRDYFKMRAGARQRRKKDCGRAEIGRGYTRQS